MTGRHIASAALDGEVLLWEVKSGVNVSSVCHENMPFAAVCIQVYISHTISRLNYIIYIPYEPCQAKR